MNKDEIDASRAKASQAIAVLAPLVATLQDAFTILSTMSSVEKYHIGLKEDVAHLEAQIAPLEAQITDLKASVTVAAAEAAAAARDVQTELLERQAKAKALADAAEKRAEDRIIAADKKATETANAFTMQVQRAQQDHDKTMAGLFTQEQDKATAIDALEARLTIARNQARKFAETLTG